MRICVWRALRLQEVSDCSILCGGAFTADATYYSAWDACEQRLPHENADVLRAKIGTWNVNALMPHLHQAAALDCEVLALQEVRISQDALRTMRNNFKALGFNLFTGQLPKYKLRGHNRKTMQLDQLVPGVGFLVKDTVPAQELFFPELHHWYEQGRFHAVKVFLNQRWVYCFSSYAPVHNSTPFLEEMSNFLQQFAAENCIFCADANSDTREGAFVQDLYASGWMPLTMCTQFDFTTYVHPNHSQSCIDVIAVSASMIDHVTGAQQQQVFEKGHKCVFTQIAHQVRQKPTWEVFHPAACDFSEDKRDHWDNVLQRHLPLMQQSTVEEDWQQWCEAFSDIHNQENHILGLMPQFRLRDNHKQNHLVFQLNRAIFQHDFEAQRKILLKINKVRHKQIRKWRKRLQPKHQSRSQWSRHLFQWIREASPPVPSCIESVQYGVDGFTTSLHDSLTEINDYFRKVYKTPDAETPALLDDGVQWSACLEDVDRFFHAITRVLAKANPNKVGGLDGIQIQFVKNLPKPAIMFLAYLFHNVVSLHIAPQCWLQCKMTCIPKKQGKTTVKDLRPLTIAPVMYRIFCKTLLFMNYDCQANIPSDSVGGICGRSACQAWLPAALACEATWKLLPGRRKPIQGIAIDTEKFFDNVPAGVACEALLGIGMDRDAVATWHFMLKHIKRYAALNGAISQTGFKANIGIPQGDPLSMLAAAALLGQWTLQIPRQHLLAKVFVDDRLLLGENFEILLNAFHTTQFWDQDLGFRTQNKTVAFGNNHVDSNVWWLDATEVMRQQLVVYLGIPLPLQGVSAAKFYEPIINKLIATLNKVARAKLTHDNAVAVISMKVLPGLCYPCVAVRPNKAQLASLRTKIFAAAASRQCQTLDAHALLNEKTHMFDPQCAMIFHCFRFWRTVFMNMPEVLPKLREILQHSIPLNQRLYGPITILQKDLAWLNCTLQPDTGVIAHDQLGSISFHEPNKRKFEHFIRSIIRHQLALQLQQKHPRWDGVQRLDIVTTSGLIRNMDAACPLKVPLYRLFSNAHATPYRLFKMGIFATPHCKFCFHEKADEHHIIWDCPRFSPLRQQWPDELMQHQNWPACATTAMVYTLDMDPQLKSKWHSFQRLVAELLFQWMEINRNSDLYDSLPQTNSSEPAPPVPLQQNDFPRLKQKSFTANCHLLPLSWKPPSNRTALNRWGATMQDFNLMFSFWSRATICECEASVAVRTWTQALAIFIQVGGACAPFLATCQNVGMAAYKFRVLSSYVIKGQCDDEQIHAVFDAPASNIKWLNFLPAELQFPDGMWFSCAWDLAAVACKIHDLFTTIRINTACSAQAIRIPTPSFIDAIAKMKPFLHSTELSSKWTVPKFANKRSPPGWITLIYDLRRAPSEQQQVVSCISCLPLENWGQLNAEQIRALLPGRPGPKKRFKAALGRFSKFRAALEYAHQMQLLGNTQRPHVIQPTWNANEQCYFCCKLLQFSVEPRTLMRTCPRATDLADSTYREWHNSFVAIEASLQRILHIL